MQTGAMRAAQAQAAGHQGSAFQRQPAGQAVLGQTAQAKSLHALQQSLNRQTDQQASVQPIQMVRYQAKQAIQGVTMNVELVHEPGRIAIIDLLDRDGPRANGFITYEVNSENPGWELKEFEAQPGGTGLGSLLLYEFASLAVEQGCPIIRVAAPALSAMGAYVAFGGRIGNPADFKKGYNLYMSTMSARPEDENSLDMEAAGKFQAGFAKHASLVEAEAQEMGDQKAARARYFKPDATKEELDEIKKKVKSEYIEKYTYSPDELDRLAYYAGLSSTLVYDPDELRAKTYGMWDKKWAVVPVPQPQAQPAKKGLLSKFFGMF